MSSLWQLLRGCDQQRPQGRHGVRSIRQSQGRMQLRETISRNGQNLKRMPNVRMQRWWRIWWSKEGDPLRRLESFLGRERGAGCERESWTWKMRRERKIYNGGIYAEFLYGLRRLRDIKRQKQTTIMPSLCHTNSLPSSANLPTIRPGWVNTSMDNCLLRLSSSPSASSSVPSQKHQRARIQDTTCYAPLQNSLRIASSPSQRSRVPAFPDSLTLLQLILCRVHSLTPRLIR
jgi:hypothetical protein